MTRASVAAWLALMAAAAGCGGSPDGIAPGPTATPSRARLTIEGPSSIAPGTSAQFVARATGADGSVRDVTTEVEWRIPGSTVFSVSPGGLVTAHRPGQATLMVVLGGALGAADLLSVPDGTYLVRGQVVPVTPMAGARVEVVDGASRGLGAEADETGAYRLFGVAGPVRLRATMLGYQSETRDLLIGAHAEANFTLTPSPQPAVVGTWTLVLAVPETCSPALRARSPLMVPVAIEQDASGTVHFSGESSEGPFRYGAFFVGGALRLDFGSFSEWDYFGPGLRFRSSDGTPIEVFGTALLTLSSPTSLGGVFEGTLFDLAPAPSCSTTRQAVEMRRR